MASTQPGNARAAKTFRGEEGLTTGLTTARSISHAPTTKLNRDQPPRSIMIDQLMLTTRYTMQGTCTLVELQPVPLS